MESRCANRPILNAGANKRASRINSPGPGEKQNKMARSAWPLFFIPAVAILADVVNIEKVYK